MIKKLTTGFDSLMRKYTPDPFIYALALTAIVFISGMLADNNIFDLAKHWGRGFWSLAAFTLQMAMILFLGYVVALSPPVRKILRALADIPKSLPYAAVLASLVSLVGAMLNWGFGLIISALYCKELGRRFSGKKFSVLVACSYSGFLVWHGGLSGSIPLVVSTPGNFTESLIGRTIPLSETIFSSLNICIVLAHFICLPVLSYFLVKWSDDNRENAIEEDSILSPQPITLSPAERFENSQALILAVVAIAAIYFVALLKTDSFSFDLNIVNLLLFMLALLSHKTPRAFLNASAAASQKIWPILVQYPFYAGIMALMQESGLAAMMSDVFIDLATSSTLPVLVYFSAGLVNIFIPSGGGQWAVQGPMVVDAARELSANMSASIMAVAWGDAWTNMIQPFWALPLLAIAGLKAKDIMSHLVMIFLLSGFITTMCFIFIV